MFHNREYLVAVRPYGDALAMHTMRFHDELVAPGDLDIPTPSRNPSDRELKMAGQLVETLEARFDPEKFEDTYRKRLLDYIEAKAKGKLEKLPQRTEAADPDDLHGRAARRAWGRADGVARALWTGSLSFGLVNVPVQIVSAVRDVDVHFRQLHKKDNAPVETKRWCSEEDKEVPYEAITRSYELDGGETVIVTDEDLEAVEPRKTKTIDIDAVRRSRRGRPDLLRPSRTGSCRPATTRAHARLQAAARRHAEHRPRGARARSSCAPRSTWRSSAPATARCR